MKLADVPRMGLHEVVTRARQEALKRLERAGVRSTRTYAAPGPGGEFFSGALHPDTPALMASKFPKEREAILGRADDLLRGRFDLLGFGPIDLGGRFDWRTDPLSGARTPMIHWSRIDPLDAARVGNVKLVWELNRHQWMVTLGQAFRLTGDERFASTALTYLRDWIRCNPPGFGINWTSALELAFRVISWSWTLALIGGSRSLAPEDEGTIAAGIHAHARHIERFLSLYSSPNTHLTGEALGLVYAGTLFPGLPEASRFRELGRRILLDESARQVQCDGVHFEQSTCYHRYSIEIFLHLMLLARSSGEPLPARLTVTVGKMLDFLEAVGRPDGTDPSIGDSDGGWLLPLAPRAHDDLRGALALSAAILQRADLAFAARGAAPEILWLLGPAGLAAFESLTPAAPPGPATRVFAEGGYVVFRNGWGPRAHQAIFDAGPLGCPKTGGHGHADLLSVQCAAFGEPFVVDAGTCCYAEDPGWRSYFRGSFAHNTLILDGRGQAEPSGPFSWRKRPAARLTRFETVDGSEIAEGEHEAYPGILHRRRVVFARGARLLVVDELEGEGTHDVELRWQLAPADVTVERGGWVRARRHDGLGLLLTVLPAGGASIAIRTGELTPAAGWVSPGFGARVPAPMVVAHARIRLPYRLATLLLPLDDPAQPPPVLRPAYFPDGAIRALEFDGGADVVELG